MVKWFQGNMLVQVLLVMAALLLLWARALVAPQPMAAGDHPAALYGVLCTWLTPLPRLAVVLAMLLVLLEGFMLNLLLANVNLVSQNSLLPTLLYTIVMSAGATTLTPLILVCGTAIASLHFLMLRGTLLTIPPEKICGATLLIGLATLFYQPALFLMLSYLFVAANYRLYSWRDWMLMLLGFAAPYVLLILVLYMTDGLAAWWSDTLASLQFTDYSLRLTNYSLRLTAYGFLAVVFLWSLVHVIGRISERPVLWQKNATSVILFTFGGIGLALYSPENATATFAIPFAFVAYRLLTSALGKTTSYIGHRKRHTWIYDILLILIIIAALLC